MSSVEPKRYHAFLSYNSQDLRAVEDIAGRLKGEGLELYLEEWELAPGREFQPELAGALYESKTCVVFLGPNGLGPWQRKEIQVAINKQTYESDFPVIPVLLPGAERPRRGDVAHLEFLINASWVEFLKTLDDERAFRSLVWGITGIKPPPPVERSEEGVCPYRGLEAFRPDDARFFFGRQNLTGWLVSALRREVRAAQGVRFLGVLGPSGSGKSSLVLAGLVPKLKAGAIEGSQRWPVAILRPGDDPLKNLAAGVVPLFLPDGALPDSAQVLKLIDDLRADERTLDVFSQLALRRQPEDVRLAVVVDQFEEVFTYRPQDEQARARFEKDRDRFFANLLNTAATLGGRVAVVLTMRSDFLSACAAFPRLAAVLSAHQELVGPMTAAELREAIEQPAFLVGCEVEPGLTERLLADVGGQRGALPLLQFALTEVWKKRDTRRLTLAAYTELGKDDKGNPRGIEGVLDHRADEIYRNMKSEDKELCRRLFLRLVQPGEGTEDTKRRVSFRELLPDDPTRAEAVKKLIHTLADRDARLVTTEGIDAADGTVEVAHEALIRGWTQLRGWVDAERAGLRTQRRLNEAAAEWKAAKPEHKRDYLYSGAPLAVCLEWVETHRDELNSLEAEFLAASEEAESHSWRAQLTTAWAGLATLFLILGYFEKLRDAVAWLVIPPKAAIAEAASPVENVQVGDDLNIEFEVHNTRSLGTCDVHFEAPRFVARKGSPADGLQSLHLASVADYPALKTGDKQTVKVSAKAVKAGEYLVPLAGKSRSGYIFPSALLKAERTVHVWPPWRVGERRFLRQERDFCVVEVDLWVGRNYPVGLEALARLKRTPGVRFCAVISPLVFRYDPPKELNDKGDELAMIKWWFTSLEKLKRVPFSLELGRDAARSSESWTELIDRIAFDFQEARSQK
jgi:hypothetical protein